MQPTPTVAPSSNRRLSGGDRVASELNDSAFDRESEVRSYCRSFPATFVEASGSRMTDRWGRSYLDFLSGCSALNYGHNDPDMVTALTDYLLGSGIVHGLDLHTDAKGRFLHSFGTNVLDPLGLDHRVQFTGPTGTNAVEAALKLARKVTGRTEIIAFTNGFHGMTLGSLAATGNRTSRGGAGQGLNGVTRALYDGYLGPDVNTADLLEQLLDDPSSGVDLPAAILLETVQGEGGLNQASPGWLRQIADIAHRHGALLIIDDVQAGCGRTGSFFSFEGLGVEPDIVTLSKSISGFGLPMALVLLHPRLDVWTPAEHNGTFRGNNLAFVTAAVAIDKFWSDHRFALDIAAKADRIRRALEAMSNLVAGSVVKGRSMMLGLDLGSGDLAGAVSRRCYETGLVIETAGPRDEVVKLLPPLTITPEDLTEGLAILHSSIAHVATSAPQLAQVSGR